MNSTLYIDKDTPFLSERPETLSDGSVVWNLHFRNGETLNCTNEKAADQGFELIAAGIKIAVGGDVLVI